MKYRSSFNPSPIG